MHLDPKTQAAVETTQTFTVAPTPVSKLAKCRQFIGKRELDTEEAVDALLEALFYGAKRAGAQITLEWLKANVDQHNMVEVFKVFREVNFPPPPPGAEQPAGEAGAAAIQSQS